MQVGHEKQVDDMKVIIRSKCDYGSATRSEGQELPVRYFERTAVSQMNCERLKGFSAIYFAKSFDSHRWLVLRDTDSKKLFADKSSD
jgi:hypothetical protein